MALISPANPTTGPEIHGSIRFTDLPVEIKEKIYEYAMRMDRQFNIPIYAAQAKGASFNDGVYPHIHATCRTNKLERTIATLVMIRNSTVCLHRDTDVKSMTKWIKEATGDAEQGFSAVRKVKVKYMSRFRMIKTDEDMKFLEACSNLHTVSLEFSIRKLSADVPSDSFLSRPSLTSTKMLEKFKLLQIAACGKLRHMEVQIDAVFVRPFPDQCQEMRKAIQVFRAAFTAMNGRELNVRLIRSDADAGRPYGGVIHWSMATQLTGDWITIKADWGDEDYEEDEDNGEEEEAEESESESGDDDQVDYDEGAEDESDESDEEDEDESDDDDEEGENDGGEQEEA
jgi:hypothetical protein